MTPVFYALLDMFVNFTSRLGIRFSVEQTPHVAAEPHFHPQMTGNGVAIETEDEPADLFVPNDRR